MDIRSLQSFLESELQYPISHAVVLDEIGSVRISTPHPDEDVDIASVLIYLNEAEYDSAAELYTSIIGTLNDSFIGRKFYDDRGANPMIRTSDDTLPEQESF